MGLACLPLVAGLPNSAAGKPAASSKSRASTVLVRSTTEGARIYIDDEAVGQVPQPLPLAIAPGTHTIKVSKPGFSNYLDTFQLKRGQELVLEIDLLALAGVLQVNASVPGAIVAVDQRQIGTVPFEGEVTPGHRLLEVRAQGHASFRRELDVVAGDTYRFDAQLVPLPVAPDPGETPWYGHWWVWAGAAAVVAGGVTAALLMTENEASAPPRNQVELHWVE